jgi:transcriptional regulator with XRE-family HTH domain
MTIEQNDCVSWTEVPVLVEAANRSSFGNALKTWRLCEELSQAEAAKSLSINKQLVSDYERQVKVPSLKEAFRIGEACGLGGKVMAMYALNDQIKESGLGFEVRLAS